jgi:cell division protein FtsI/penicillin-binding protein 2
MRGGTTPDTPVSCTPQIAVGGRTFSNVPGYPSSALGDVPFRTAFANSCNTAMISLSGAVSQQALHDAAADLGLGVTWDLGAPAYGGDVPTQAPDVEHAASMIGQGKIQASPLAMATVAASVANGARVSPVLVHSNEAFAQFSAPSGSASGSAAPAPSASATAAPPTPSNLTAEEADTLRSLMRSVVTDGSATVLTDLGPDIGAKTGTAQYGDGSKSHVWMIAFDGDLAVAVFLETGETGATTAGPIMHAFLVG